MASERQKCPVRVRLCPDTIRTQKYFPLAVDTSFTDQLHVRTNIVIIRLAQERKDKHLNPNTLV
jgi:hypothetical protein